MCGVVYVLYGVRTVPGVVQGTGVLPLVYEGSERRAEDGRCVNGFVSLAPLPRDLGEIVVWHDTQP